MHSTHTVKDNLIGVWQEGYSSSKYGWSGAKGYCIDLTLDGYSDWRLPNIDELMSISDKNRVDPAIKNIFKYTKSSFYWSSSEVVNSSEAWYVYFRHGYDGWSYKSSKYYVRCVRGGQ